MSLKEIDGPIDGSRAGYEWGKVINFGVRGNAARYCTTGWSDPESGLVWTNSLNSRLSFAVPPPTGDITFVMNCHPFTATGIIDYQELHLYVNFMRVAFLTLSDDKGIEIQIPKHVFALPHCDIDLYIPSARSPFELGLNPDIRRLGLAITRLVLIQH